MSVTIEPRQTTVEAGARNDVTIDARKVHVVIQPRPQIVVEQRQATLDIVNTSIIGVAGSDRIGAPTAGDYSSGFFAWTSDTRIADAFQGTNEQLLANTKIQTPTTGDYSGGAFAWTPNTLIPDAFQATNLEIAINKTLQDPTTGDYTGGPISLVPADTIADAVQAINEQFNLVQDRVGWVRIVDVLPQAGGDTITDKVFDDPPGNTVLQSCTSTSANVKIIIEGSFPRVVMQSVTYTMPLVGGLYRDTIDLTLAAPGDLVAEGIDPDGNAAARDTVAVALSLPPTITAAVFTGGYPGSQAELKEDDLYSLSVTADKSFNAVVVYNFGAGKFANIPVTPGTTATVSVTIADRGDTAQLLPARVAVIDTVTGAWSATYDTDTAGSTNGIHVVNLNNLHPTVTWGSPTYPGAQQALKGAEAATVPVTLANLDTVLFDTNGTGELSVTNPTTIEATKTATRIGGTYNISSPNLRGTANRAANDATTVATRVVNIANVAPTITVSKPFARLRSGGLHGTSPQDYSIQILANQNLLSAPSMDADPGGNRGTFQGGGFTGAGSTWARNLRIDETVPDEKGTFTFQNLLATGLAGIVQTTIGAGSSYTLGGFVQRVFNFAPFTADSTESVVLVDQTKLASGSFSNGNAGVPKPFGTPDTTDIGKEGWFAPTAASGNVQMHMLHTPTVAANTGGITLSGLEEQV